MIMVNPFRKFVFTSHIMFSVGGTGSVVRFTVLANIGLKTRDDQLSRSALVPMELSAWLVIVPFCSQTG